MPILDDPDLPSRLSSTPRPVTARARRRSWNELPVRVWVIVTLAVMLATGFITFNRIMQAREGRWLIENGVPVIAKVLKGNGSSVPKRWLRDSPIPATIQITLPGKQPLEMEIIVDARQGSHLQVGGEFAIKVDPNNPQRWTEETQARPWSTELVVPAMLVPVIAVLSIVTLLKRRNVLKVWSEGTLTEGVVVETRHTAAAPGSRIIRYSLADGNDPRVFSLLLPTSAGLPDLGQRIWLIAPENDPKRAIAAGLYVDATAPSATT